jgi:hypothetical protein
VPDPIHYRATVVTRLCASRDRGTYPLSNPDTHLHTTTTHTRLPFPHGQAKTHGSSPSLSLASQTLLFLSAYRITQPSHHLVPRVYLHRIATEAIGDKVVVTDLIRVVCVYRGKARAVSTLVLRFFDNASIPGKFPERPAKACPCLTLMSSRKGAWCSFLLGATLDIGSLAKTRSR